MYPGTALREWIGQNCDRDDLMSWLCRTDKTGFWSPSNPEAQSATLAELQEVVALMISGE